MGRHHRASRRHERFRLVPWLVFLAVVVALGLLLGWIVLTVEAFIESTVFVG